MRSIVKTISTALAALILFTGSFVAYYDWHEIRPFVPTIQATLAGSAQEDRNVPSNVEDFIWKIGKNANSYADWQVVRHLLPERYGPIRMGTWHFHGLMWSMLLPLHFDKHERTALYCHYLLYEDGEGLSNAANFYFHKQPHELTTEEIATILTVDKAPRHYSPSRHPQAFEEEKQRLLAAYAHP